MLKKTHAFFVIILLLAKAGASAQYIFTGTIIDDAKVPLQGVTISADKKIIGISDIAGNFKFTSTTPTILISFSFVGFQTQAAVYKSGQPVNITLSRPAIFLAEAIVKAYERNTTLKNIPVSVTVLGRTDLDRYDNNSIVPAVNTVPGVKMDERSPGSYRLSIRGNLLRSPFGVRNVKIYWNGIPFTDANGNTYLNQIDFNNIGKMEIIKGPGGSMYGAGTGGVVLLSGRIAGNNEKSLLLNTSAGSYGTIENNIAYRNGTENSNSVLQYSHLQSDGWRNHTNMRRDVANYTGSFTISKKQFINAVIFYSDLYYQTPGGLTKVQMDVNPRQARPAGIFGSAESQQAALYIKTFYAGLSNEYQFNSSWSNTSSIYTSGTRFRNPSILNYQRKTEQGMGGRSVTQYDHKQLTVHFGGEYQYGFTGSRTFGNKQGIPDTLQFDDEVAATQYNIFLQANGNLPSGFIINAGISYNNYRYGFTRLNQRPVTEINKTFDPVFVPRISLLKKITEAYSLYATVSKGFSPPTIDEIVPSTAVFNTSLNAEKVINYELGFRGEIIQQKLFVDAAYYLLYLNNTIVTRRDNSGADYFVNTGKTSQHGFELSVNYYPVRNQSQFLQELKLWGNFTHINASFKTYQQGNNDYSGNKLTGTSPNVIVAGADASTKIGLYVNCTYSYTDAIPLNDANTFSATAYNLFFARAGYKKKLGKVADAEIFCSFNKSFNTAYSLGNDLNAAGSRFFNPSAPENITGGIKLMFKLSKE